MTDQELLDECERRAVRRKIEDRMDGSKFEDTIWCELAEVMIEHCRQKTYNMADEADKDIFLGAALAVIKNYWLVKKQAHNLIPVVDDRK